MSRPTGEGGRGPRARARAVAGVSAVLALLALGGQSPAQDDPRPPRSPVPGPAPENAFSESADELLNLVDELEAQRRGPDVFEPVYWLLDPWRDGWNWVDRQVGLEMGFAYTALYQAATGGSYKGQASGAVGDLDAFGTYYLFNRGVRRGAITEGTIGFLVEHRHALDGVAPAEIGRTIGSLWGTTSGFDTHDFALAQLWWQQWMFDDRLGFRVGKLDMAGIFDVYRFNSANHFFQNAAFSDNPAIPFPGNGVGAAALWRPDEAWFVKVGSGDAEGRKTEDITTGNVDAWFSVATAGWNGQVGSLGTGLYQVTAWHSDRRAASDKPSGSGFSLVAQQEVGGGWVPFVRYAWSSEPVVDVRDIVTAGAVREGLGRGGNDRFGAAVGWGRAHDRKLRDQWAGELFYRWQLIKELRVTAHAQVVLNPSRNPGDDAIGVFGVRARLSF